MTWPVAAHSALRSNSVLKPAPIAAASWPSTRLTPRPRPNSVQTSTGSSLPVPASSLAENALKTTCSGCSVIWTI